MNKRLLVLLGVVVLGVVGGGLWLALGTTPVPATVATIPDREAQARPAGYGQPPPNVRFTEVTRDWGVAFVHRHGGYGKKLLPETTGSGVLVFDFNGDGFPDLLFVNGCRWDHWKYDTPAPPMHPTLYLNDGAGHFTEVSARVGLDKITFYGMGVAAGDIDNDGFPDVLLTGLGRVYLLHNEGGQRFTDITESAGLHCPGWSTAAAFLDYDRDGKLDLFVGHYVQWTVKDDLFCQLVGKDKSYCQPTLYQGQHCQLFHNEGGLKFADVSARAGIQVANPATKVPAAKCLGVAVHDYDGDGWPDIAVANDTTSNFLFHNNGDGTFTNVAAAKGVELINDANRARGAMGIDWGYYREQGQTLGLAIANFANEPTGLLKYSARTGTFTDIANADGVGLPSRLLLKFGLFFFDYDLDGRPDLFTSNGHIEPEIERIQAAVKYAQPAQLFWNAGPGRGACFQVVEEKDAGPDLFRPRVGRGAAYGDLDGDGDLDIVLNNNNQPATILRNDCPPTATAIRLRFRGVTANRDGYGCRVQLTAGGQGQQAELNSGGSYLSQSEAVLTFGLGGKPKAEKITIRWPNRAGTVTELTDLAAGFTYLVDEAQGVVEKRPFRR